MKAGRLKPAAPNGVTMLALMFGVTSINMALWSRWNDAVVCILLACLFDFLDGKVARLLRVSSRFGAELDSLSDFVCFGVAPGFLMYNWSMDAAERALALSGALSAPAAVAMPWACALFLAMCCGARLARFNAALDDCPPPYWKPFFTGVPAPAGGFLAMAPLVFALAFPSGADIFRQPWFSGAFVVASGFLMISRLPTLCLKHLRLRRPVKQAIFGLLIVLVIGCFYRPWLVATVVIGLYIVSIPCCFAVFLKLKKRSV